MLHALVLRSPHAHATIRSIDTTAARLDRRGSVVTALDLAEAVRNVPTRGNTDADDLRPPEHPVLAGDKVCYVGQPVAIVVAEDQYVARDALELIQVDYELLPSVVDPLGALAADAPIVHQALGTNLALQTVNAGGDLDEAFALADHIVRQRFQVQRIAPAPMEPRGVLADYQSQGDLLTVWDSTQHPHEMREHIAHLLGRSQDSVRVIAPDVGGGFGEKGCMYAEEVAIPYLSILLNRPIRWTRQENMVAFHGRGHTVDIEAAAKSDGTLLGIRVQIWPTWAPTSSVHSTVPVLTSHRLTGPYRTPAMSVEVKGVITNKPPTGAYRGAGGPEAAFCMERTVDLIARDLGLDPVEIRRKNFIAPDAFPYETPTGITYDSGNYSEALERALELSDYQSWKERAEQHRKEDTLMGVGLATVVKGSGARVIRLTDHARVIVDSSGQVTAHTGVSPHGQGSVTTFSQLVADSLGVTPWDVQVLHSDTDILPEGGGTSGSRGMIAGGSAMYYVLEEARQSDIDRVPPVALPCRGSSIAGRTGRSTPTQAIPFPQVAAAA